MKKYVALVLFCFIGFFSAAQNGFDLYGVSYLHDDPHSVGFIKINPDNGNLSIINKWSNETLNAFGNYALDPKNKMFYQVTTRAKNMYLLKVDLTNGKIVDTVFTQDSIADFTDSVSWISDEINTIFYNCADDHIYFIYFTKNKALDNSSATGARIAKVDGVTGKLTLVDILPEYIYGGQQYCDILHQKIYLYRIGRDIPFFYVYDLKTKQLTIRPLSRTFGHQTILNLVMNSVDNMLYGLAVDYSFFTSPAYIAKAKIIRIDPSNGEITDLSSAFNFNGATPGSIHLEHTNNTLYFIGYQTNPGYSGLFTFNFQTGKITAFASNNLPDASLFLGVCGVSASIPDTAFSSKNFCQYATTTFSPATHNGLLTWNFGDPASGNLNTSTATNPNHVYTQPGTYSVKMISSNCWRSDTTTNQITIEAFPKVDLGEDITWCMNKKQDPVELSIQAGGHACLWQDLTTDTTYTVKETGLYWVEVSASCGSARDSVLAKELPCRCEVAVAPTYTHTTSTITFDCDLFMYDQPYLELFNEQGQIVRHHVITESQTVISFEGLRAGMYFYRINNNKQELKSGKIIFVK